MREDCSRQLSGAHYSKGDNPSEKRHEFGERMGMRVGLSTWSLAKIDLTKSIRLIGESGLQCIELWGEPPHAFPDRTDASAVRDALSPYALKVSVHGPYHDLNLGCVYPTVSESILRALREYVGFSERLGATTLTFHPGHTMSKSLVDESIQSSCRILAGLVKESAGNLRINIENEGLDKSGFAFMLGSRSDWFDAILSHVPELGITLDTGHANLNKEDPVKYLAKYGKRVTHAHLSNNRGLYDEHNVLREGTVNVRKFLKNAKELDIAVNLELNPRKYPSKRVLSEAKTLLKV